MTPFVEGNISIENIKLEKGCRKKNQATSRKIADTIFEGNVWENISDVNHTALIIQAQKQTSLKRTSDSRCCISFLCISLRHLTLKKISKNDIVFYNC